MQGRAGSHPHRTIAGHLQYNVIVQNVEGSVQRGESQTRRPLQLHLARWQTAPAGQRSPPGLVAVVADQRVDDALGVHHADVCAVSDVHGAVRGDGQALRVRQPSLIRKPSVSTVTLVA